ncbi:hypothetical protein [Hymenobacter oligotrophus]|nr:hypothetical protein [Hymenobacter oligotrophus]
MNFFINEGFMERYELWLLWELVEKQVNALKIRFAIGVKMYFGRKDNN